MAKTYSLTGTLNTGRANSISNDNWSGFSTQADAADQGSVGKDGRYYVTNILFNSTTLDSLRSKTISSITLTLTPGALERNINFLGCYKLNSTSTSWTRSDKDSSAADASTSSVLFEFNPNGHTTQFTISNKSGVLTVPKYGLVIGPATSNVNSRWIFTAATLNVTTNETDFSYTLAYNANGVVVHQVIKLEVILRLLLHILLLFLVLGRQNLVIPFQDGANHLLLQRLVTNLVEQLQFQMALLLYMLYGNQLILFEQ